MKLPAFKPGRLGLTLLLAALLPTAWAYTLSNGSRWEGGTTTFHIGMPGKAPSGTLYSTAFAAAMQQWTSNTPFKYVAQNDYVSPCAGYSRNSIEPTGYPSGTGDQNNSADFQKTVCGNDWGSGVLALTMTYTSAGEFGFSYLQEADIVFNDNYSWDVYTGDNRSGAVDFGRTALHELGHALGLGHSSASDSIMAPKISNLYQLQADDIAGATALYGTPTQCQITDLQLNSLVQGSLGSPDCRIMDLFNGGSDKSYVDVYRLKLTSSTHIVVDIRSTQLDPVIVLTDANRNKLDIISDNLNNCNARMDKTLPAGEYLILANTFDKPTPCGGNLGAYSLSVTDGQQPTLGTNAATSGTAASSLFTGGASADGGASYQTVFTAQQQFDVSARIVVDPAQVGQNGKVFVLAQLSNGTSYSKNSAGVFVPFSGNLNQMAAYKSGPLAATETINVAQGLRGQGSGLAGLTIVVYVGYALDSSPQNIQYGSEPIKFSIDR